LPPTVQKSLFVGRLHYQFNPEHSRQLLETLAEASHLIGKAPFPIETRITGTDACPCTGCSKRSSFSPLLFDDGHTAKDDRCLDPVCWAKKRETFLAAELSAARKRFPGLLVIRTAYSYDREICALPSCEHDYDPYRMAKKNETGKPAFVLHGPKAGKVVQVMENKGGRFSSGGKAKREVGANGKPVPATTAERQKTLHLKRLAFLVNTFNESLASNFGPEFAAMPAAKRLNVLLAFGSAVRHEQKSDSAWADFEDFGGPAGPDAATLESNYVNHLAPVLRRRAFFYGLADVGKAYEEAARICRDLFGYPLFVKHYEDAMKELPVPKSWKGISDPWAKRINDPYAPENDKA
jgi:hypothetical protein